MLISYFYYDYNCKCTDHSIAINDSCNLLIECCLNASTITIPQTTSGITKEIPGWNDLAKQEREQSLFWHWIWCECSKPYTGHIYNIMKKTRHTYHYAVCRLKRNKTRSIKLKLTEKSNNSARFWQEIKKLNHNNSILPDIVDNENTDVLQMYLKRTTKKFIQVCQLMIWRLKNQPGY